MKIYKLTNTVTEDFYVGKTKETLQRRFTNHKTKANSGSHYYLHNAMRYYGYSNFVIECIEEVDDEVSLNEREIYWIETLNPIYNMHAGGQGGSEKGRPDIQGESRKNWLNGFNRKGKTPWNKGKTGLGGYKHSKPRSDKQRKQISEFQKNNRVKCVYCGFESNAGNIGRYHNEKCKLKK